MYGELMCMRDDAKYKYDRLRDEIYDFKTRNLMSDMPEAEYIRRLNELEDKLEVCSREIADLDEELVSLSD